MVIAPSRSHRARSWPTEENTFIFIHNKIFMYILECPKDRSISAQLGGTKVLSFEPPGMLGTIKGKKAFARKHPPRVP